MTPNFCCTWIAELERGIDFAIQRRCIRRWLCHGAPAIPSVLWCTSIFSWARMDVDCLVIKAWKLTQEPLDIPSSKMYRNVKYISIVCGTYTCMWLKWFQIISMCVRWTSPQQCMCACARVCGCLSMIFGYLYLCWKGFGRSCDQSQRIHLFGFRCVQSDRYGDEEMRRNIWCHGNVTWLAALKSAIDSIFQTKYWPQLMGICLSVSIACLKSESIQRLPRTAAQLRLQLHEFADVSWALFCRDVSRCPVHWVHILSIPITVVSTKSAITSRVGPLSPTATNHLQ